jgi:hypothetical protein
MECRESTPMSQKLLEVLFLAHCSHELSWPRRGPDGQYYQVCLLCASQYKYDWKAMRRTERVQVSDAGPSTGSVGGSRFRKPTWVPRARRLKFQTSLRYRAKGQTFWHEGKIENLSQSGLLFKCAESLPPDTPVEMIFEMPEEISGQKNSSVQGHGRLIRCQGEPGKTGNFAMAVSIVEYQFLH